MYNFCARLVEIILKVTGSKARIYEGQNVPKEGGYIVACTHTGYVDILNLGVSILPRQVHFMAKKQLFDVKVLGWLLPKLHAFPVDRDNPGPSVIKIPSQLLKEGKIVGIFPSGTRNADGSDLKQGAITIAQLAKAQIVPAAYIGPNSLGDLFSSQKGHLIFGEPFYVTGKGKEGREEFTHHLENEMASLADELQKRIDEKKK